MTELEAFHNERIFEFIPYFDRNRFILGLCKCCGRDFGVEYRLKPHIFTVYCFTSDSDSERKPCPNKEQCPSGCVLTSPVLKLIQSENMVNLYYLFRHTLQTSDYITFKIGKGSSYREYNIAIMLMVKNLQINTYIEGYVRKNVCLLSFKHKKVGSQVKLRILGFFFHNVRNFIIRYKLFRLFRCINNCENMKPSRLNYRFWNVFTANRIFYVYGRKFMLKSLDELF
jgi:hypothetical protein